MDNNGKWMSLKEDDGSWGPLVVDIVDDLLRHLRTDQDYDLQWRSNGSWGFELRILVTNTYSDEE